MSLIAVYSGLQRGSVDLRHEQDINARRRKENSRMLSANGALNPLVSFVYRITGGRVPSRMGALPVMLLTTTGFKSGRQRTNPVLYFIDGANLVTAASAGGSDKNPVWLTNLVHNPVAVLTIRRERRVVLAREATPEERDRLWPLLTERFRGYENYSKKTKRLIPVVIFSPA